MTGMLCPCAQRRRGAIVERSPPSTETVCDDLRLADAEIPMFDARGDGDVLNSVPPRPLQGYCRCWIFALASTDLFDDGIWNEDLRSEAFD